MFWFLTLTALDPTLSCSNVVQSFTSPTKKRGMWVAKLGVSGAGIQLFAHSSTNYYTIVR